MPMGVPGAGPNVTRLYGPDRCADGITLNQRRNGELRTPPDVRAPTPPQQFASQSLLEVLVQWWRRLPLTTNASFCARVSCLTTYSRASAFPTERNAS